MPSHKSPSVFRRPLLAALLFAVGCSGTGASCGSSCGGAFKTTGVGNDGPNVPYRYAGSTLDNVASVRITKSAFDSLFSAGSLNDVLAGLGNTLSVPCIGPKPAGPIPSFCACTSCPTGSTNLPGNFIDLSKFGLIVGDANFNGQCDANETTPVDLKFKQVTWALDSGPAQMLRAKIILHVKAALYLRTLEAHSSLCSNTTPIQGRIFIDDEALGLTPQDTELDLDLKFTTAPDGRLVIAPTDASIAALVDNFNIAALGVDGSVSANQLPPSAGSYQDNGCSATSVTSYDPYKSGDKSRLACSEFFNVIAGGCNAVDPNSSQGIWCSNIWPTIRKLLFDQLKLLIKNQVTAAIKTQLDNLRCERPLDASGKAVACSATQLCPKDDRGIATACDTARGVCVAQGQDKAKGECEPTPFAIQGQIDLAASTSTPVGFPSDARLNLYAGLGGTTAPAAVSPTGLQIAARAGTQPAASTTSGISVCVPPTTFPPPDANIPALDFDLAANLPASMLPPLGDASYDLGFSVASQMLNRGFYDGFNGGLFCLTISNKTASLVSSSLFKTFLPSLGLLAGGKDVPMSILLRPTLAPAVRIGKGTLKLNADGTYSPDDALIGIQLNKLNLDFYAIIDERSVRLFTLQADVNLPLGLRTFAGAQADQLQPVLGGLATVLTNITAINNEMLAEDPTVLKDLIGAAVSLAQPLLASALQPITLPKVAGLDFQVKGLGGAVAVSATDATQGFHHLGIWAQIARCGAPPLPVCARYTVGTEARIADRLVPDDLDELRGPNKVTPSVTIEAKSISARPADAEFSYRIDSGLWSPWVRGPRFTVRDPLFLFQGHHQIDVTSREAGDDRTMNQEPVSLDFLVSIEPPSVDLVQLNDGSVVTKAHSTASAAWQLSYSYRLEGEQWTQKGPAHTFTAQELGGRGVQVVVTDEAGRTAKASLGLTEGAEAAVQLSSAGCATSPQTTTSALLPLLAVGLLLAFRRRGSR